MSVCHRSGNVSRCDVCTGYAVCHAHCWGAGFKGEKADGTHDGQQRGSRLGQQLECWRANATCRCEAVFSARPQGRRGHSSQLGEWLGERVGRLHQEFGRAGTQKASTRVLWNRRVRPWLWGLSMGGCWGAILSLSHVGVIWGESRHQMRRKVLRSVGEWVNVFTHVYNFRIIK